MQQNISATALEFPHAAPPAPGSLIEIAPGVRWFRLPLPYRLDHVNIYLIEDDDGWTVLDTGLGTDACRTAWESILSGPLAGQRLTSMIVTHFHPDHVGLAGWLAERFDLQLSMPRPEYLYSLALQYAPGDLGADMHRPFYRRHGLSPEVTDAVLSRGHEYLGGRQACPPPIIASSTAIHCGSAPGHSRRSQAVAMPSSRPCCTVRKNGCSLPLIR